MFITDLSIGSTETKYIKLNIKTRVSVQGVKSLGRHFACLCRGFEFYEVKKKKLLLFFKKEMEIPLHFNHFYSEKYSKSVK